jgi:hypothetical protein
LGVTKGGTGISSCILGNIIYGSAENTYQNLAPNTSTTKKYLSMTGTGSGGAIPSWEEISVENISVENYWSRAGTVVSLSNANDSIEIKIDGVGSTLTKAIVLSNNTESNNTTKTQMPGYIEFFGGAWDTDNSVNVDQVVRMYMKPYSYTTPFSVFKMVGNVDETTWYNMMVIDTYSGVSVNGYTGVGHKVLESVTSSAYWCTAFGYQALYKNDTGYENTAVGFKAGLNITSGYKNTIIGACNGWYLTTGDENASVGARAFEYLTTGNSNTGIGAKSCNTLTTGNYNTGVGAESVFTVSTQSGCTGIGYRSLYSSYGNYNTGVGYNSGRSINTGTNNTFIGADAGYNASQLVSVSNSIAIGYQAYTTESNQCVIGNSSLAKLETTAVIKPGGYKSSDGSDGITQIVVTLDLNRKMHTLTFKNGLLVTYASA